MNNLEYLEKMKKADESLKVNLKNIAKNEEGDSYRIAKALEIIAEELIKHNELERAKFAYIKLKGIKIRE